MRLRLLVLLVSMAAGNPVVWALADPLVRTEPHELRSYDGRSRKIELCRLTAPEEGRSSRTIEIGFYRLPAKSKSGANPIVFLMGGPGIAGTLMAPIPPYYTLFDRLSERADVIVLDQRGLGTSEPRLDCPPAEAAIPADFLLSSEKFVTTYRSLGERCSAYWKAKGTEPAAFSVQAVADDLERLRVALRAGKLDLLAFSFGTRVALEALRRHPRSFGRVVLQGVKGFEDNPELPAEYDATFERAARLSNEQAAAKSFAPDLRAALRSIQLRLEGSPLSVPITNRAGSSVTISVGREGFDGLVSLRLGDVRLPALISSTANARTELLARFVESLYRDLEGGAGTLMARTMVCSVPPSARRITLVRRQARSSLFGRPMDTFSQDPAYCGAIGALTFRPDKPVVLSSDVPVLLVTGTLDSRTPLNNAARLARSFSNAVEVIVENGDHELLPVDAVQRVVVDFFAGKAPAQRRLILPKPEYRTLEESFRPMRPGQ